jgi:alpha-amylase
MFIILILLSFCCYSLAATAEEWRGRTIYQILTDRFARTNGSSIPCANFKDYCGGSFQGITSNLNYITGMGFDAIWISPVPVNYPGGYHGYWATNWTGINPNFGTPEDLINLVDTAHENDVWVMVDVVANHVGPVIFNYTEVYPFDSPTCYHQFCQVWNSFSDSDMREYCRLDLLPDLAQEFPPVKDFLLSWVGNLTSNYSLDGLRVDTVPFVPKWFWEEYTPAAGVFTIGEVLDGDISFGVPYQGPLDGLLNYPMFFVIRNVF